MKKLIPYFLILSNLNQCNNISYHNKLFVINLDNDNKNEAIFLNKNRFSEKYSLWLYTETQTKHFSKKQKLMTFPKSNFENNKIEVFPKDYDENGLIDLIVQTKIGNGTLRRYVLINQKNFEKNQKLKFSEPLEVSVLNPRYHPKKNTDFKKINHYKF